MKAATRICQALGIRTCRARPAEIGQERPSGESSPEADAQHHGKQIRVSPTVPKVTGGGGFGSS